MIFDYGFSGLYLFIIYLKIIPLKVFYAKQHKCIENRLVKHGYLDILLSANGGILPSVNLSDLIRFKLLAAYDEVWVDATIYLTKDLDDTYFNKPVFF